MTSLLDLTASPFDRVAKHRATCSVFGCGRPLNEDLICYLHTEENKEYTVFAPHLEGKEHRISLFCAEEEKKRKELTHTCTYITKQEECGEPAAETRRCMLHRLKCTFTDRNGNHCTRNKCEDGDSSCCHFHDESGLMTCAICSSNDMMPESKEERDIHWACSECKNEIYIRRSEEIYQKISINKLNGLLAFAKEEMLCEYHFQDNRHGGPLCLKPTRDYDLVLSKWACKEHKTRPATLQRFPLEDEGDLKCFRFSGSVSWDKLTALTSKVRTPQPQLLIYVLPLTNAIVTINRQEVDVCDIISVLYDIIKSDNRITLKVRGRKDLCLLRNAATKKYVCYEPRVGQLYCAKHQGMITGKCCKVMQNSRYGLLCLDRTDKRYGGMCKKHWDSSAGVVVPSSSTWAKDHKKTTTLLSHLQDNLYLSSLSFIEGKVLANFRSSMMVLEGDNLGASQSSSRIKLNLSFGDLPSVGDDIKVLRREITGSRIITLPMLDKEYRTEEKTTVLQILRQVITILQQDHSEVDEYEEKFETQCNFMDYSSKSCSYSSYRYRVFKGDQVPVCSFHSSSRDSDLILNPKRKAIGRKVITLQEVLERHNMGYLKQIHITDSRIIISTSES